MDRIVPQFAGIALECHLAGFYDVSVIGNGEGGLHILLDQEDCSSSFFPESRLSFRPAVPPGWARGPAKVRVDHKEPRISHQAPADGAHSAAGRRSWCRTVGAASPLTREKIPYTSSSLFSIFALSFILQRAEEKVFPSDGHPPEELVSFRHEADAQFHDAWRPQTGGLPAVEDNASAAWAAEDPRYS